MCEVGEGGRARRSCRSVRSSGLPNDSTERGQSKVPLRKQSSLSVPGVGRPSEVTPAIARRGSHGTEWKELSLAEGKAGLAGRSLMGSGQRGCQQQVGNHGSFQSLLLRLGMNLGSLSCSLFRFGIFSGAADRTR